MYKSTSLLIQITLIEKGIRKNTSFLTLANFAHDLAYAFYDLSHLGLIAPKIEI